MAAILSRRRVLRVFFTAGKVTLTWAWEGRRGTLDKELRVFYLSYIGAELRRRAGRTALTALGLGVGVGLVVTVTALSKGLDNAQQKVLKPLTGVGTDMSVTRPLRVSGSGSGQTFTPGGGGPPDNINFAPTSVTGIDQTKPSLAPVTPGQLVSGRYFSTSGGAYDAILSDSYARSKNLNVGSTVKLGGKTFKVVGLSKAPL